MTPSPGTYHHGHLREALVEAALEILRGAGVKGLGLRAAARRAGVSAAAPYHHFKDKRSLLAAVAEQGFRRFRQVLLESAAGAADDAERLACLGRGYVSFAVGEPALFRLMFGPELVPFRDFPDLDRTAAEAFGELRRAVAAARPAGRPAGVADLEAASLAAWARVHGLAVLLMDRRIPVEPGGEAELAGRVLEAVSTPPK